MTQVIYGDREGVERVYGRDNVAKWADADNRGDAGVIALRITWALAEASAFVESRLSGRRWAFPLEEPYPTELVSNVCRYAGVLLYESPRGQEDSEQEGGKHNLSAQRKRVLYWLRDVRAGRASLGDVAEGAVVTTPQILEDGCD